MDEETLQKLKTFFNAVPIQTEDEPYFSSLWKAKTFGQNELITEAGNIERHFYFVVDGVQAIYLLNEKGEKVVLGFSYSGSPSGVFDSFIRQHPSDTFLEALKPSRLLGIKLSDYQQLFERHPKFHKTLKIEYQQMN